MNGYFPGSAVLPLCSLLRALVPARVAPPTELLLYRYARHALVDVARNVTSTGGRLWVPTYICREVTSTVSAAGIESEMYPVQMNLEPDWGWLMKKLRKGDLLLLVHYFGFPNALDRALVARRDLGILLLEDCAHSFLTEWHGRPIGSIGDYGIYSFRKVLPVTEGAQLILGECLQSVWQGRNGPGMRHLPAWTLIREATRYFAWQLRIPLRRCSPTLQNPEGQKTNEQPGILKNEERRIAETCYSILKNLEPTFTEVVAQRRTNYARIQTWCLELAGRQSVFLELKDGVCPQTFPLWTNDSHTASLELHKEGIPANLWPDLPSEAMAFHQEDFAKHLYDRLVFIPIHQSLREHHLKVVEKGLKELKRKRVI